MEVIAAIPKDATDKKAPAEDIAAPGIEEGAPATEPESSLAYSRYALFTTGYKVPGSNKKIRISLPT